MCSLLDPCQEGNCTNTPEGYRCTCNEGFHGVNCSEAEPVPGKIDEPLHAFTSQSNGCWDWLLH